MVPSSSSSVGKDSSPSPPNRSFIDKVAAKGLSSATAKALYDFEHSHLTGDLPNCTDTDTDEDETVSFKPVFTRSENVMLYLWIVVNVVFGAGLVAYLVWPTNLPEMNTSLERITVPIVVTFMVLIECIRISQTLVLAFFAARAKDPVPMQPQRGLRVAVLTTIVPNKEPFDLVLATLLKMKKIKYAEQYGGSLDVWILDEGNDPFVKNVCEEKGINHFSRKGIPAFNQDSGPFKAKTKHGNHNSWRASFEDRYDIVGQADPDHVPYDSFLERTLGYFRDPEVAFVVAPQVYGNLNENWIAYGSAFLAYVFHGIIQRGGNGMMAPLLIGTNHLYRVTTFTQIGGYQDSIIEDHLTAMQIFATKNPDTNRHWKGVYTPDIVSVGEGPTSFTDFFNQQKRWAYGIWQIVLANDWGMISQMKPSQRLSFLLLQSFYPSVCLGWILSIATTLLFVFTKVQYQSNLSWGIPLWAASLASGLGFFIWLRRFNLVAHERKDMGLVGMGLMLMTIPIYVDAGLRRLACRKLAYAVTAKGDMATPDNLWTFAPHLQWAIVATATFVMTFFGEKTGASSYPALRVWLCWILAICLAPIVIHYVWKVRRHWAKSVALLDPGNMPGPNCDPLCLEGSTPLGQEERPCSLPFSGTIISQLKTS